MVIFILNFILILKLFFFIVISPVFSNNFKTWKNGIISQAIDMGISKEVVTENIGKIDKINKKVLKLYNNQPEFKISFKDYKNRNITKKRIDKGKELEKKYKGLLDKISNTYGVPSQIIVSIWALESNFGYYTGSFNIIDSLATLSFQSRRKSFFKKELFNALIILDKKLINSKSLKGSWAGAMGQSQFMPSSYLNYAVDYNQDNKIDIWNSEGDVFASIANYLYKHGWKKNQPWSFQLKSNSNLKLDTKKLYTLKELDELKILNKKDYISDKNTFVRLKVINSKNEDDFFIIFENFSVIKKYNNSDFYALTVGKLANKIH
ncbi:MAG: Membrane-bound lytic murein transglycosylase B [Alphaproteobacteria bacterium MarineAlpha9_Bin4]|nr:MAG: Membrane-bound lytic murein transglycosylase B [Alphaproteobacteria bacterium MarineAlpha9_Bin4]